MKRSSWILLAAGIIFVSNFLIQAARFAAAETEAELHAAATSTGNFWWLILAAIIIGAYGLVLRSKGQ